MCEEYNGWPNRETWAAALHLTNDQGAYGWVRHHDYALSHDGPRMLGEAIREFFEDEASRVTHEPSAATDWGRMMVADVGSLWRVDWVRIAENIYDELEDS